MKKLFSMILCLLLLAGCVPVPLPASAVETVTPAPATKAPATAAPATQAPTAELTPAPTKEAAPATATPKRIPTAQPTETAEATEEPEVTAAPTRTPRIKRTPKPTRTPKAKRTARATAMPTPTPKPTKAPTPQPTGAATARPTARITATPKPTAVPDRTYTGTYFKFTVPGSWTQVDTGKGVRFYPDASGSPRTYFLYQEAENDMGLTEAKLDIALMFSSKDSVTEMVEKALTGSGMTNFKLSPMTVQKTKLNGLTCYKGASNITQDGETYDFVGHIFIRGKKLVLFVWVGDQTKYASSLKKVYDSIQGVK